MSIIPCVLPNLSYTSILMGLGVYTIYFTDSIDVTHVQSRFDEMLRLGGFATPFMIIDGKIISYFEPEKMDRILEVIGDVSHVIHPYPTHGAAVQRAADQYFSDSG
ncbi:hypothetical protein [Cohnella luojiensis]|uniref:Thioredoxin-like fold domain-containing protein n=1 Tax=Cohnella luojiensis TaxID=652876 RepID=A0A4Y8LMX4_9BACL|nr:hypothetical protein [Cohnella luojiensis]TFE19528.1 hypothetical protein E2980_22845 [Cohnella luojiensis]